MEKRRRSHVRLIVVALLVALMVGSVTVSRNHSEPIWNLIAIPSAVEVEHFDSLGQMSKAADSVIVGSVSEVFVGRVFGDPARPGSLAVSLVMVVKPDRVIKGALPLGAQLSVEFVLPGVRPGYARVVASAPNKPRRVLVDDQEYDLPSGAMLFILRRKGDTGVEIATFRDAPREGYYRPVNSYGIVTDLRAVLGVPLATPSGANHAESPVASEIASYSSLDALADSLREA